MMVFNKMDANAHNHVDEHFSEEIKQHLLNDLYKKWQQTTNGNAVFISATQKDHIDVLRYKL